MAEKTKNTQLSHAMTENFTNLVDVNTVIGKPFITESGAQIIPFTKVTIGHLSGSGEYGETKVIDGDVNEAGASGLLINIKPEGFLIDDGKNCRLMNVTEDPIGNLVEKAAELIENMLKRGDE